MIVKLEEDPKTGDKILNLPDELIKEYNLKEGDTLSMDCHDGKIILHMPSKTVIQEGNKKD